MTAPSDSAGESNGSPEEARTSANDGPLGGVVVESENSFTEAVAKLTEAVDGNPNLALIRTVDHQKAAASRGLELPPTIELFFGNPALGSPLMQASQTAGIDLPQKMLVWQDPGGTVRIAYNGVEYLRSRHGIVGEEERLQTVSNALANLAAGAAGVPPSPVPNTGTVAVGSGLVTRTTDRSADDSFAAVIAALEAAPPVSIAFKLEHDANATKVGLDLRPTKLVVFGNPSLGTLLMQTDQSLALDLPQKILVYADADGQTTIAYNDPTFLARRHGVLDQQPVLQTLSGALANFANAGT